MRLAGFLASVVSVAAVLHLITTPDTTWVQLQFVWGSPRVEIESQGP